VTSSTWVLYTIIVLCVSVMWRRRWAMSIVGRSVWCWLTRSWFPRWASTSSGLAAVLSAPISIITVRTLHSHLRNKGCNNCFCSKLNSRYCVLLYLVRQSTCLSGPVVLSVRIFRMLASSPAIAVRISWYFNTMFSYVDCLSFPHGQWIQTLRCQ